ncbi:hypothetical protein BCR44DRAFT_1251875 [Catenaria anguillulae PL171]|uniref:Uncharacterized protein n=1 Tax=Catenaria anguillulae PL171 TaxID=765915 RepID=A0A1Y2HYG6_9FUNG|nr:hypothetical protein BCR44DRAFT_1251875 [Catenaria anguillulae PL171]
MFAAAFETGRADIIQWWFHEPGPLRGTQVAGHPYMAALCPTNDGSLRAARMEALTAWVGANQPMDYARCIHEASISGLVEVLDWLYKIVQVPTADFVRAWSSKKYYGDFEEMHYEGYDRFNHGESLLWWRANLPQVCTKLEVNRGHYYNPIHVFTLEYVLKSSGLYDVHWPYLMSKLGNAPLLAYIHQQGYYDEDLYRTQCEPSLLIASQRDCCNVLEWWKRESGQEIKLPLDIVEHRHEVGKHAKVWWTLSGLVQEGIGATSQALESLLSVAENVTQGCETQ